MTIERLEDGMPAFKHNQMPVVAGDAIILLSGVNFGSVEKVLAAVHAISQYAGTDSSILTSLPALPLRGINAAYVDTEQQANRILATRRFCEDLVDSEAYPYLEGILKLRARFT